MELTATDMRQIAHSEECVEAVSESFLPAALFNSRSRLWVFLLYNCHLRVPEAGHGNKLEIIESFLPRPIAFNSYLHTPEDHFLSSSKVNTQLNNVTIINREGPRLDTWLAKSDMIEKCTRRALDVLDVPLALRAPEFAMLPTDHFGLEPYWCR